MKRPRSRSPLQEVYCHEVTGTRHHWGIYSNWFQPDLTGSFLFFFVEQHSRELIYCIFVSVFCTLDKWQSLKALDALFLFSSRTMIVSVSEQTRRLRSESRVILREKFDAVTCAGDFDRQILTWTKSPADGGVAVMGQ